MVEKLTATCMMRIALVGCSYIELAKPSPPHFQKVRNICQKEDAAVQPAWHPWGSTCSINCSCSFLYSLGSSTLAAGPWHRHRKSFWLEEHTSRPYPGVYEHSSKGGLDAPSNWCLEFASEAIFKPIKGFSFSLNCSSWETEFIICYTSLIVEMHIKLGCVYSMPLEIASLLASMQDSDLIHKHMDRNLVLVVTDSSCMCLL